MAVFREIDRKLLFEGKVHPPPCISPSYPLRAEQRRLRQHDSHRFRLPIRRIAVFVQDPLHPHLNPRPQTFAKGPINRHTLLHLRNQLGSNELQLIVAQRQHRAVVGSQCIVKIARL